jgi:REP element-mobilizing transposase RayT
VAHSTRERFPARFPLHVTLRLRPDLPSLRRFVEARTIRRAIAAAHREGTFGIVHFSIQTNHIHLICEAVDATHLARGIQGLAVRIARRLNRHWHRRGSVLSDRYHARALRTPREVRNAITYVIQNARHHAHEAGVRLSKYWIDPCSSAPWFTGWKASPRRDDRWLRELDDEPCPTTAATTWLLSAGWHRWRAIAVDEVPGR